jgi:hypothetical protein
MLDRELHECRRVAACLPEADAVAYEASANGGQGLGRVDEPSRSPSNSPSTHSWNSSCVMIVQRWPSFMSCGGGLGQHDAQCGEPVA